MPRRLDRSWLVFDSIENDDHDHCVDLFSRPDSSFGFEVFRRDVEDRGAWTPVHHYSSLSYPTQADALKAASGAVGWLDAALGRRRVR
jgi:hypothetical protein